MKVETRVKEIMTKSTFGLNGNLKYPETTLKIRKMCGCFANPLENDMKFSPQTSSDFAHAQTLFSSVGYTCFEKYIIVRAKLVPVPNRALKFKMPKTPRKQGKVPISFTNQR